MQNKVTTIQEVNSMEEPASGILAIFSRVVVSSLFVLAFASLIVIFPDYPQYTLLFGLGFVVLVVSLLIGPFYGTLTSFLSGLLAFFISRELPFFKSVNLDSRDWVGFALFCLTIVYIAIITKNRKKAVVKFLTEDVQNQTDVFVKDKIKLLIWECRSDGFWEYANSQWEDFTGLTIDQLNKIGCEAIIHPEDVGIFSTEWSNHLDSPEPFQVSFRIRSKDGMYKSAMTEFIPDKIVEDGARRWILASHIFTLTDVQPKSTVNDEYSNFLEAAPYLIAKIDSVHRVINLNKNFERYFKVSFGFYDKSIADLIGMKFYSEIQPHIEVAGLYHEAQIIKVKAEIDDEIRSLKIEIIPQINSSGAVTEYILCFDELSVAEEQRYQKAENFDEITLFIWTKEQLSSGQVGKITQINQRLNDFIGMKEDEIKEAGEKVFLHIDDFRSYQVRFEDAQRKRAGFEIDIRLISSKGEMKPCTLKVTPIRGDQGRITGWINVCVERSLLSGKGINTTDPIFQFFGDAVPNFLLILSSDYFIEFSNTRWQNYTGLHPAEDRYNNWREQIHSDDLPKLNRLLNGFKIHPKTAELELRVRNKFGEYHWHSLRVVPITVENGALEKAIVTISSVEQKRKALEELRRKDQKFNLALETGKIGIWEYNTIHNSITLSGKSNEFMDLHKDITEIAITKFFRKIYKADRVFLVKSVKKALKEGREFRLDVRVDASSSDEHRYLSIYGTPTVNSTGEISGLFGTIMDVTETKKIENSFDDMLAIEKVARKEAERRGALKDQFLASVSSELKTPFNAILGWSQALQKDMQKDINIQNENDLNKLQSNPERVGDYLQRLKEVERNALLQSQLVESLLEVSRVVSGSVELTISKVDLFKTFSEVVSSIKGSLAFKGINYYQKVLTEDISQKGMFIEGDGFRLQQALWNCLNSISTIMSKGESITTLIKSSAKWIEIGFELKVNHSTHEKLSMVFKNAENWDSLTNRDEKIAAVNFLLAQYLISFHLGSFVVIKNDRNKSVEDTFRLSIKLPVNKEVVTSLEAKNTIENVVDLNGKRVLLLHSDPLLRKEISKVLENSKAEVVSTDTIHDAVEVYKSKKADIILTDLSFEDKSLGKNGQPETQYTFIKKIKDLQLLNKDFVPTIALSGLESKTDKVEAVSQGYQACVSSPLEEDRLVGLIADLVKAH